jgi:ectoine hydroxylase-related dioxygenase (phytanoyl-CoA dioxygenase family)
LEAPSESTFSRYSSSVARRAGSAVFFNPRTFHRGMPNRSDCLRCGLTIFAVRPFMKQRFDFPQMLAPAVAETLAPRARRFLGFDARPPAAMSSFYAPAERRTYKPNQE